jgi:hypothetical protein
MISDSRFDLALDVVSYYALPSASTEAKKPEVTPNATTPDIQTNWFGGSASISHQTPSSNSTNMNKEDEDNNLTLTVKAGGDSGND